MMPSSKVDWTAREAHARRQRRDRWRSAARRRLAVALRLLCGVGLSVVLSGWSLSFVTHVSLLLNPPGTHLRLFTDHLGVNLAGEFQGPPHQLPWWDVRLARWDDSYTQCGWNQIFRNPPPRGDRWSSRVLGHPWLLIMRLDCGPPQATARTWQVRLGVRYWLLLLVLGLGGWYGGRDRRTVR